MAAGVYQKVEGSGLDATTDLECSLMLGVTDGVPQPKSEAGTNAAGWAGLERE